MSSEIQYVQSALSDTQNVNFIKRSEECAECNVPNCNYCTSNINKSHTDAHQKYHDWVNGCKGHECEYCQEYRGQFMSYTDNNQVPDYDHDEHQKDDLESVCKNDDKCHVCHSENKLYNMADHKMFHEKFPLWKARCNGHTCEYCKNEKFVLTYDQSGSIQTCNCKIPTRMWWNQVKSGR
jgi:hypothetical protein